MKIGFIGAGKVGKSFGKYLSNKGLSISGYFSRRLESAEAACQYVGGEVFNSLKELIQASSIIFITTPDDMITTVAEKISEEITADGGILQEEKIFLHMSGAHPSSCMSIIKEKHPNSYLYSLHPLQAFADVPTAVEKLNNTVFSIEGDVAKLYMIKDIMKKCNNNYFVINGEDKGLYHAAACVVSNYLVTLMDLGLQLLEAGGIESKEGFEALYPLIEGSLGNIKKFGTADALTGPIARGDVNTIKNHITSIEAKVPHLLSLYSQLGKETTTLAQIKKLNQEGAAKKIEALNLLWKEGKLDE